MAKSPPRERVDYKYDRDDGEEDAVDVDVERRRRSLVVRALSFPSVLDGAVHVMSPLSSTHALQERFGSSSRVTRGLKLRPAQVSFTTAGAPYCSRACTDGGKSINFTTARRRRDVFRPDQMAAK